MNRAPEFAQPAAHEAIGILIVDDDARNLAVLETVLHNPEYRLVRASSGKEALLALLREDFAVVVLDVSMPGMSGFEVARLLKDRKKTAHLPIIFLTAFCMEEQHLIEGYVSGAVDYLHKPVKADVLRSKVAVFADLFRKERQLTQANQRLEELNEALDVRVRQRTQELETSEALLREADRRKDEFLATLAHELRNPLAPMRNAVELIRRGMDPQKLQWVTDLLDRQVGTFSRLIDDLMDVSRISRGRIGLLLEPVRLQAPVGDALQTVQPLVCDARHELTVHMPDDDLVVHGDRTRLAQAFTNLLTNAVKYTPAGGRIELRVRKQGSTAVLSVQDSGIGIARGDLSRIFDMFSQVESALERSRGGLGIGLALTQRLVHMHGGSVNAHSEGPGGGSRFDVMLPLLEDVGAADDPRVMPEAARARSHGCLRILVADDNEDAAGALATLLELLGHEVRIAHDGQGAIRVARSFDPQLVLLDIGMPKVNGLQACRQIRADAAGPKPLLVALTGWGQQQDRERSSHAGFDHHLVKPVALDTIMPLLDRACTSTTSVHPRNAWCDTQTTISQCAVPPYG